jgi:nucleotide-binding universal stress UspA family protein
MNIKKILFPTDLSPASDVALPLATSLARDSGALLLIVHVGHPQTAAGCREMYYGLPDPTSHESEELLNAIVPTDPEVEFEHHVISGEPVPALVRFAKEQDVDLIVMSTHGREAVSHMLMGSVAEAVVRRAPCPVLTLKAAAKQLANV